MVCCCITLKNATAYSSSQKLLNKSAMHAVISLLLQRRKFWWYLLLTSLMLLHDVIMTSYCCQRYADCLVTICSSRTVHRHTAPLTCNSWTVACVKKRQTFLCPACGLQTAQISVLWITRSGLSCSIVPITDKSIVWTNWNSGPSMSGAVLNSQFLTRLLTSSEEDIKRVSMLKENIWGMMVDDLGYTLCMSPYYYFNDAVCMSYHF